MIKLGGIFDLEAKEAYLSNLKEKIADPSLWDNNKKTTSLMKEISLCEKDINLRKKLFDRILTKDNHIAANVDTSQNELSIMLAEIKRNTKSKNDSCLIFLSL